jgi:pilus assembly protein Flp/PilA
MLRFIMSLSRDERGVSALEYAILAAIIVSALVAVGTAMSDTTTGLPGLFSSLIANVKGHLPS